MDDKNKCILSRSINVLDNYLPPIKAISCGHKYCLFLTKTGKLIEKSYNHEVTDWWYSLKEQPFNPHVIPYFVEHNILIKAIASGVHHSWQLIFMVMYMDGDPMNIHKQVLKKILLKIIKQNYNLIKSIRGASIIKCGKYHSYIYAQRKHYLLDTMDTISVYIMKQWIKIYSMKNQLLCTI